MTVAIIAEYNPFHSGHKYHIDSIRENFGADTTVVAVMSGNYTQRGEFAIADKYLRAEWATLSGVDLTLELPFPYSMSSAEIFAKSAVSIIKSIGAVDYISFGSESGDINELMKIAENMTKSEYKEAFSLLSLDKEYKMLGYPALVEASYRKAFECDFPEGIFEPNNILAIEYLKAIHDFGMNIGIHTVKRRGAGYNSKELENGSHESALAIREALLSNNNNYQSALPEEMRDSFLEHLRNNDFPTDKNKLSAAVISHFRINQIKNDATLFDDGGGLYNRLKNASLEATDLETLISLTETKKFTNARIKRAILYSFLGVTSSDVKELPEFSQILGFTEKGRALLKTIKKNSAFPLLTKPSAKEALSERGKRQKEVLDRADSVFQLTKPYPVSGAFALREKPFVK